MLRHGLRLVLQEISPGAAAGPIPPWFSVSMKIPNTKHEIPMNYQILNFKNCQMFAKAIGAWCLELLWILAFGSWIFSP